MAPTIVSTTAAYAPPQHYPTAPPQSIPVVFHPSLPEGGEPCIIESSPANHAPDPDLHFQAAPPSYNAATTYSSNQPQKTAL